MLAHHTRSNRSHSSPQRRGAAIVEMAVVCVMFFMLLFGIFEYCRYLFVMNLAQHAARDTGRYLVVKTNGGNMPNDTGTAPTDAEVETLTKTGIISGRTVVVGMSGLERNLDNFAVTSFVVDPAGMAQSPPVIRPLIVGGTKLSWNSAGFGQRIAVKITGTYRPIGPALLLMPSTIPFEMTVMVNSEGN